METNDPKTLSQTPAEPSTLHEAAASPKPTGNQLTTALIVIIVVLLFVMLILSLNGQLFTAGGGNDVDIAALTSRNAQLRADANAERARQGLPPLPEDSSSARMTADRLQRDATSLASLAGQWQTELETKDAALLDLQSQLTSRDENAKRLYAQIASLQTKLDEAANSTNQVARLGNDLKMANNQIDNYRKQLGELQGQLVELQKRPSDEEMATLRKQLNDSVDSRNKLQIQIDGLIEAAKNKIDRSQYDGLVEELAKLRPQINEQRYEIQRLRAELDSTELFIESEKDLPAEAARLFTRLRTLEDTNKQQLVAAYETIRATLGAEIVHRQTFATGSSQITFEREKIIQDMLDKRRDANSFFLIVGYASKSGGTENNRILSAKRATTVASVVNTLKAKGQQVKAVYLGETARFSPTAEIENQICEVWEIKK